MVSFAEVQKRFPSVDRGLWNKADQLFPIRITRSWFERMKTVGGALSKQVLPNGKEISSGEYLVDPVGELSKVPVPFVVQKHPDRALLLLSRRCHVYCRYCFRRNFDHGADPSIEQLDKAIDYLLNANLEEVILSGGDPLMVSNKTLFSVIQKLSTKIPIIRIHTRAIVTAPFRINHQFIEFVRRYQNIWIIIHCNHPDELNDEVQSVIHSLVQSGIPLLNQSVLLKGVNDDPNVLAELSRRLVRLRVFPYYLHHTDKAQGAGDFIVSLSRGMEIYNQLGKLVSGVSLPRYVIDPPSGSGKVDVGTYMSRQGNN